MSRDHNLRVDITNESPATLGAAKGSSSGPSLLDMQTAPQTRFYAALARFISWHHQHPPRAGSGGGPLRFFSYLNVISPRNDALVLEVNVAGRAARYLLGATAMADASGRPAPWPCWGMPGLRLEHVTRTALHLRHLPTDGHLVVRDSDSSAAESLLFELRQTDVAGPVLGTADALLPGEEELAHLWEAQPEDDFLAALIPRLGMFPEGHSGTGDWVLTPAVGEAPARLWWSRGPRTSEVVRVLTHRQAGLRGTEAVAVDGGRALLRRDGVPFLLDGPSAQPSAHYVGRERWWLDDDRPRWRRRRAAAEGPPARA